MKFTVWCVGVLVILHGLMTAFAAVPAWRWVWITLGSLWILIGAVLCVVSLAKLALVRAGKGALARLGRSTADAPPVKLEG